MPTTAEYLGEEASSLLEHECKTISKDALHLPGPDFVDRVFAGTDRNNRPSYCRPRRCYPKRAADGSVRNQNIASYQNGR